MASWRLQLGQTETLVGRTQKRKQLNLTFSAVEEEDNGMDTPRPIHIGIQKLSKATKSFYFQVEQLRQLI